MSAKRWILVCGVVLLAAASRSVCAQDVMESQLSARLNRAAYLSAREAKQAQIVEGRAALSGIAIEAIKSHNPLQLFNPYAPVQQRTAEDNFLPDPPKGNPRGWTLFSIQF